MNLKKHPVSDNPASLSKQMSYNDVVQYLNGRWNVPLTSLDRMVALDKAFENVSKSVKTIAIAGTNGKSLTAHFAGRLLNAEGLKVGTFSAPHILTYNERLAINHVSIPNKTFTDLGQMVINRAQQLEIEPHALEVLTLMALLYFKQEEVDVAILEVSTASAFNPVAICNPTVAVVTRVTAENTLQKASALNDVAEEMLAAIKPGTHVVSGDQNKACLSHLEESVNRRNGRWAMPIRKLAPLRYPFEQLHGRCAALAERAAHLFLEETVASSARIVTDSLLLKQEATRGRPSLTKKRAQELNPRRTITQFWNETVSELPCRFDVLDKEKPTIILDIADNVDAFTSLLLGTRLRHYERQAQGLTLIIGAAHNRLNSDEFLKTLRYFFKKTPGTVFICPITQPLPGVNEEQSWNVEAVTSDIRAYKIKARGFSSFAEAFEAAKQSVDERNGTVVITGSASIISEYWQTKGIKKLS